MKLLGTVSEKNSIFVLDVSPRPCILDMLSAAIRNVEPEYYEI